MGSLSVSQKAIDAIHGISEGLEEGLEQISGETLRLGKCFQEQRDGLGAHSDDIGRLLEALAQCEQEARAPVKKLCLKLGRAAAVRRRHLEENRYGGGSGDGGSAGPGAGGGGAYVKKTYPSGSGTRLVFENQQIDPDLIIPAGTKFGNGVELKESKSNLELMEEGMAPFVAVREGDGNTDFVPVELHHATGREKIKGAEYFGIENPGGTLIELPAHIHDRYDGILHIPREPGTSFRKDHEGKRSEDAKNYDAFRKAHWKERARQIRLGRAKKR